MSDPSDVTLVEEVIRDGSYTTDFAFDEADLRGLLRGIDSLDCVDVIDVGPGTGFGTVEPTPVPADERYLEIVEEAVSGTPLTTIVLPGTASNPEIELLDTYADLFDHVRVGVDVTAVRDALPLLNACAETGIEMSLNLLKTYLASPEDALEAARWGGRNGADSVYVVDSAGGFEPNDVDTYVKAIRRETDLAVGFHGHDNLGMGLQNALAAVDAGATYVDSSLQGIGRSAGNVQTELLVAQLRREALHDEWSTLQRVESLISQVYPESRGNTLVEILFGLSKLHSSSEPHLVEIAERHGATLPELLLFASSRGVATVEEVEEQFSAPDEGVN